MIKVELKELIDHLKCDEINFKNILICGVDRDSRTIKPEQLYIPIEGTKFDGHSFIEDVKKKGIKVSLWNRSIKPYPNDICLLLVDNTLQALQEIAKYYLKKIGAKVIAITGSNGKTSIKDMAYAVIKEKYKVSKTIANYNNDIGLPLSILNANLDDEYIVLEMGMDNLGDIDRLTKIAKPYIAIISNIGSAHLEFLKTRENIAKAKLEIINNMDKDGYFIKNGMEPLLNIDRKNTYNFGNSSFFDIFPKNIKLDINGLYFDTNLIEGIRINTFGIAQVENALPVILMSKILQIEDELILKALENVEFTGKRNLIYPYKSNYIFDDSYKSNPEGLYKALETMRYFNRRRVAVLADMKELGDNEIEYHKAVGEKLYEYNIDKVYLYGELSKYTYEVAKQMGIDVEFFADKHLIVEKLKKEEDSIILFKASNSMKIFEIIEEFKNE